MPPGVNTYGGGRDKWQDSEDKEEKGHWRKSTGEWNLAP